VKMKILFITSNRIGDAVLSTGLLNHLIQKHPDAQVTLACGPAAAPLFAQTPNVVQIIAFAKAKRRGHWYRLWKQVARTRWNLVVDLRASAIAWTLRAKRRMIYRPGGTGHRVLHLSDFMGLEPAASPVIWLGPAQVTAAKKAIPPGGLVLGIGPTANWGGKQWPEAKFFELIQALTASRAIFAEARVAVFGAASERGAVLTLLERLPRDRRIDLVGRMDILTSAACVQECHMYVGNDSGLMHLAAAVGTPALGLFGPSRESMYGPWGDHCASVRTVARFEELSALPGFHPSHTKSLMDSLAVNVVEEAAVALWQRAGSVNAGASIPEFRGDDDTDGAGPTPP
jgi:heptosyltransferase-3